MLDNPGYADTTQVWSPEYVGIPASRIRRCSAFHLRGIIELVDTNCEDIFYRSACSRARSTWEQHQGICSMGIAQVVSSGTVPQLAGGTQAEQLLTTGNYQRLEGFDVLAMNKGDCDSNMKQWQVGMAIVNVTQQEAFFKQLSTDTMPALLRKSQLVDLVSQRAVFAMEDRIIMGCPHPAATDSGSSKYFPGAALLHESSSVCEDRHQTPAEARQLCGNATHWSFIGIWHYISL